MLLSSLCLLTGAPIAAPATPVQSVQEGAKSFADDMRRPGPRPRDVFHPDNQPGEDGRLPAAPEPAYGGRIIMHLESMPENLNRALENSTVTRNMHQALHDTLLRRDREAWDYRPRACRGWEVEDMVVLKPGAAEKYGAAVQRVKVRVPGETDDLGAPLQRESDVLFGAVSASEKGLTVTPVSRGNPLEVAATVSIDDVLELERGSVFTFSLRDDVFWHPAKGVEGHRFDARDVVFSWSVYLNPAVDCDQVRYQFLKITKGEVVDELTARFFYESQYFSALSAIGSEMMLLPSHFYDLSDPDNPDHDPDASAEAQAAYINENPLNSKVVGLGPYRITEHNQEFIEVERFEDYYDEENAGYFDTIRWRYIADDNTAFQALLNGELDFFSRVKSADYFGAATRAPSFSDKFYKGYFYYPSFGFTAWNTYRPQLAEREVRVAIAHAFDFEEYERTMYKGLALQVTGPFPYVSPAYDTSVEAFPFDPEKALDLLEEAGWYDRNGNGIADKNGVELEITFLLPSGNDASKNFGLKLQESLDRIGILLKIEQVEWATFGDKLQDRDFDCANLAWVSAFEDDPEQLWHSKWGGPDKRSSNFSGMRNAELDALIERGQRELDDDKRQAIWHEIQRLVYHEQPFLFMYNVPRKFALNKSVRGFQSFALRPGYNPVKWYYPKGTPGTRATLGKR